jgi:hypothetical protein
MPSPSSPLVPRSSAPPRLRHRSLSTTSRRSTRSRADSVTARGARVLRRLRTLRRRGVEWFLGLPPVQQAGVVLLGVVGAVGAVLSVVYHDALFHWLAGFAQSWRALPMGWMLLWMLTVVTSFPPVVGYSTAVMLAGFVYGFPNGCVAFCLHLCRLTRLDGSSPPRQAPSGRRAPSSCAATSSTTSLRASWPRRSASAPWP